MMEIDQFIYQNPIPDTVSVPWSLVVWIASSKNSMWQEYSPSMRHTIDLSMICKTNEMLTTTSLFINVAFNISPKTLLDSLYIKETSLWVEVLFLKSKCITFHLNWLTLAWQYISTEDPSKPSRVVGFISTWTEDTKNKIQKDQINI